MQKDTDNNRTMSDDGGEDRQHTRPGLIAPTIGLYIQEGFSVRSVGGGDVPSTQQHGPVRYRRELGCPGGGSQQQGDHVRGVQGGAEGLTQTSSEVYEG